MASSWRPAEGYIFVVRDKVAESASKDEDVLAATGGVGIVKPDDTKEFEQRWQPWGTVIAIGEPELIGSTLVRFKYPHLTRVYIRSTGTYDEKLTDPDDESRSIKITICPFGNVVMYQLPETPCTCEGCIPLMEEAALTQ